MSRKLVLITSAIFLLLTLAVFAVSQSVLFTPRVNGNQISQVQIGMSRNQLVNLLGQPHHVEHQGTPQEAWAYYEGDGMFSPWIYPYYIEFDAAGNVKTIYS